MIFEQYESYKDSGVEWLGEIPSEWSIERFGDKFIVNKNKNLELKCTNLLSLSYGKIIRKDINSSFGLLPASFDTYQIVQQGYIIMRLTDLQNDKKSLRVGLVQEKGMITSAYIGIILSKTLNPAFIYYLLYSYDIMKVFYWQGGSVRQSMGFSEIKALPLLYPDVEFQTKIVTYLDQKTQTIDKEITLLEQKITKYKEHKQTLINETVLRGLDKNVKHIESEIEWLGEIPEGWEVKRLKDVGYIYSGLSGKSGDDFKQDDSQYNRSYIPFTNIAKNKYINIKNFKNVLINQNENQNKVRRGDIFFLMSSEGYDDIGKSSLLLDDVGEVYLNSFCKGFRIKNESIENRFINYLLSTSTFRDMMILGGKGFTRINLKIEKINDFTILKPPYEVQIEISNYLDAKTNKIDEITQTIESKITLLKELRKTLINDAVIGKIKVS